MLRVPAKTVYIDPAVRLRENCLRRLNRVLPSIDCQDVRDYDDEAREAVFRIGKRRHGKDQFGDEAVVVFTTFDEARRGWHFHFRDAATAGQNHGGRCQSALELNLVDGCLFRCAYCGFGRYLIFHLDVEHFVAQLDGVFETHPAQRLYKYSNMTDLPPFEPELDAVRPVLERFAGEPNRYLMLFTKSDNVGFLGELDHRGHTIISWSLTSATTSRLIDNRAATMEQRIEAMASMQAAGYPVRARLSPVVPIRNWRAEYEAMFELLFARTCPDLVTLELLGWMDVADLTTIIDRDMLDPGALAAAEAAAASLEGVPWGPFTQATHDEVYGFCIDTVHRLSPRTPVSVCHGTAASWARLEPRLRMTPDAYLCNCGANSAPGSRLYDHWNPPVARRTRAAGTAR